MTKREEIEGYSVRAWLHGDKPHKCAYCGKKTYNWEKINGGPYNCWECGRKMREGCKK